MTAEIDILSTLRTVDLLSLKISNQWEVKNPKIDSVGHQTGKLDGLKLFALLNSPEKTFEENELKNILNAIESQKPHSHFIGLIKSILNVCYTCGEEVEFETNGLTIQAKNPCPHPNGISLTFELNIPSGVMVVANDLRDHFNFEDDFNVNTAMGIVKTTKAMEKIGCAHAFVGNSSPGVYKTGENTFIVASSGYNEKTGGEKKPKGKRVATICTDLWWYSIVDWNEFKKRKCNGKYQIDKVKVKPGVYRFSHFYGTGQKFEKNFEKPSIFTKIEWLRIPDPVKKYKI